ncbi:MAG TPA: hypothetical protein VG675_12390 [Bryobacteraceae bacterium]|nr:hypothetical protein [Bryobacteraceae bacterium]
MRLIPGCRPYQAQPALDALQLEREDLEEEVRQLRAAVQMYTEVVRRLSARSAALA